MVVTERFQRKIEEKDIVGLRDALFSKLSMDITLCDEGEFAQTLAYILKNGISESDLFEADDGYNIPLEVSEKNLSAICAKMGENFSKEKLTAAKKMAAILFGSEKKESCPSESGNSAQEPTRQTKSSRVSQGSHHRSSDSPRSNRSRDCNVQVIAALILMILEFVLLIVETAVSIIQECIVKMLKKVITKLKKE